MLKCLYMPEGLNYLATKKTRAWYKRWWGILLLALVVLLAAFAGLVAYNFYLAYQDAKRGIGLTPEIMAEQADVSMSEIVDDLTMRTGPAEAPIQIVEFGDFNCQYSLAAMPIIKQVLAAYPDKIALYWRNYPVVAEDSPALALGGFCADEQGGFWKYHDRIFQLKKLSLPATAETVAVEIDLDLPRFQDCLKNQLTETFLRKDYYASQAAGVSGTPTFVINGFRLSGAVSFAQWKKLIDVLLPIYEKE